VLIRSGKDLATGNLTTPATLANFISGNADNRGGIRVTARDIDGDRVADLVVGDGNGAGSRVTAYPGRNLRTGSTAEAFGFDAFPGFNGGVFVG
jgi:hypothetical protein